MAIRWDKLTVKSQEAVQGLAAEHGTPEGLPALAGSGRVRA